ncbi:AraC family transcriptional regulator [Chitinophaga tropicalis]|uniref:Helix-turn-helix domain-containing protein n=1 Tax=Chitinophaga tropicalis TaxID=2683588 RepID=A0A7K1U7N9_9BACT|nr:AraC family transcriptional regulator [Chitinophaga tropicalis]MVT10374.1 helix-turn-helix domain-containing protein [Chitinophaga tropicalis]
MQRYIQHEFLKISHFTSGEWEHPVHNHNHFELIFIHKGRGVHYLSDMKYPYEDKMLFLLAPSDHHYFDISSETTFTFIKFTNVYLQQAENRWNRDMDEFLNCTRNQPQPLISSAADADKLDKLLLMVVSEWKESNNTDNEAIFFLLQTVLSITRRNLHQSAGLSDTTNGKITAIINYIHRHIYSVEYTQQEHLSKLFGLSKKHLGTFFKEQTGIPLRDYVNRYKLRLVENRLKYSSLSLKEIGHELGFTDLSHFNKFFKHYHGINPTLFRENSRGIRQ